MKYIARFLLTNNQIVSKSSSYGSNRPNAPKSGGGAPCSTSSLSALGQTPPPSGECTQPIGGERQRAPLPPYSRGGRGAFRSRASAHRSQMAVSGGAVCSQGNPDADRPAKPGHFKPAHPGSVPRFEP